MVHACSLVLKHRCCMITTTIAALLSWRLGCQPLRVTARRLPINPPTTTTLTPSCPPLPPPPTVHQVDFSPKDLAQVANFLAKENVAKQVGLVTSETGLKAFRARYVMEPTCE